MPHYFILGSGILGNRLAENLLDAGNTLEALRRNSQLLTYGVKKLDLTKPNQQTYAEVAFITLSPQGRSPEDYQAYSRQIAEWVKLLDERQMCRRIILVSSTRPYALDATETIDESSPSLAIDAQAGFLMQAEEAVNRARLDSCVVRFSGLYGLCRWFWLKKLLEVEALDTREQQKWLGRTVNWLHQDDAVGFLLHLARLPQAEVAAFYVLSDQLPMTHQQRLSLMQEAGVFAQLQTVHKQFESLTSLEPILSGKIVKSQLASSSGYSFCHPRSDIGFAELFPIFWKMQQVSPLGQQVLHSLKYIPRGKVIGYKSLCRLLGRSFFRSVGKSLSQNPCAPELPCHRVIESNLQLGGFNGNKSQQQQMRKKQLLEQEGVLFSHKNRLLDSSRAIVF